MGDPACDLGLDAFCRPFGMLGGQHVSQHANPRLAPRVVPTVLPVLILLTVLLLGVVPVASAQAQAETEAETEADVATATEALPKYEAKVLQDWFERMQVIDALLLEGRYKKARKDTNFLLDEICDRVKTGDASEFLSMAALLRAIAESGLGNDRDARWDLGMAKTFSKKIGGKDLSAYGEAGRKLADVKFHTPTLREEADRLRGMEITKPERIRTRKPKYPLGKRYSCIEAPVLVGTVIGTDGKPKQPYRVSTHHPVMAFAALDTLRDWKFKPALGDGEPIEVFYNVTVNYKIPACSD